MSESGILEAVLHHCRAGAGLTLFLDYDGTLVPIARTPEEALPDESLPGLLGSLSKISSVRTLILSGRPLASLRTILPVPGLALAGVYGAEILMDGKLIVRGASVRESLPMLVEVKKEWSRLIHGRDGFMLEDKGRALALHARWAETDEADSVLTSAREIALGLADPRLFRILSGHRFLEVAPAAANKGQTVDWFLNINLASRCLPVYFGDDNKDEEAFPVIRRWGGYSIGVGAAYPLEQADAHLASPDSVREWLRAIAAAY